MEEAVADRGAPSVGTTTATTGRWGLEVGVARCPNVIYVLHLVRYREISAVWLSVSRPGWIKLNLILYIMSYNTAVAIGREDLQQKNKTNFRKELSNQLTYKKSKHLTKITAPNSIPLLLLGNPLLWLQKLL